MQALSQNTLSYFCVANLTRSLTTLFIVFSYDLISSVLNCFTYSSQSELNWDGFANTNLAIYFFSRSVAFWSKIWAGEPCSSGALHAGNHGRSSGLANRSENTFKPYASNNFLSPSV